MINKAKVARNSSVDICRILSSFLVISIHFPFPGMFGKLFLAISRIAVPFFFSVSGYFFYKGDPDKENSTVRKRITRLLKLLLISELVYFSFYLLLEFCAFGVKIQSVKNVLESYISNYMNNLPTWPLALVPLCNEVGWFLAALCGVYLLVYICNKWRISDKLWIFSVIYMVIHIFLRRFKLYSGYSVSISERFLFCQPLFFFLMGYKIRKHHEILTHISTRKLLIIFSTGCILSMAERLSLNHTVYIGTFPCVFSLLLLCVNYHPQNPRPIFSFLERIGRECTDFIYIMHLLIINNVTYILIGVFPALARHPIYPWLHPIFGCILVTLCAILFSLLKKSVKSICQRKHHRLSQV